LSHDQKRGCVSHKEEERKGYGKPESCKKGTGWGGEVYFYNRGLINQNKHREKKEKKTPTHGKEDIKTKVFLRRER